MRRARAIPATLAAVAGAAVAASLAWGAFTDVETSPQTLQAADTWPIPLHMTSGTYVGNGVKPRAIKATSFKPDLVIIRGDTNQTAVVRTATMTGDQAKPMVGGAALTAGLITSLDANGFTVGSDNRVNASAVVYYWVALQAGPGTLTVASYVGNGAVSRPITGVGFSPEYVAVHDSGNARAVQRYGGMSRSYQFDADTGQVSTRIASLDADGFTVGNANETNRSGNTFHYYAFNNSPGSVDVGSYTGDGADNRNITGIGFRPGYVSIRSDNTATARRGAHRFTAEPGDHSFLFDGVALPNLIQDLLDDGFQVGTDLTVNQTGIKNFHLALRNSASSCQQTGTYSVTGPADAWIGDHDPARNNGGTNDLRIKTKVGDNRRSLVRHTLPALDPDCEVKSAKLVLTSTNEKGGRTLHALTVAAAWGEKTVTWNNQPATTGSPIAAPSPSVAKGTSEFDVTALVRDMYAGTITNNGFLIKDSAENDPGGVENVFASNESGNGDAQLILVVGAP